MKTVFSWEDPFLLSEQIGEADRLLQQHVRIFAQTKLFSCVTDAFQSERFPIEVMREMGELGLIGANIQCDNEQVVSEIGYGLIAYEIEKVDSGFRSAWSIMSGLVMHAIHYFGSAAQCQHYLPKLKKGKIIGSFCLTEPEHGSDPGGMETHIIEKDGERYLTGHKKWIGLSPIADIFVVWAKNPDGKIQGYLLEKNQPGITCHPIINKLSLRAASVGEVIFKEVKIKPENILPKAIGLSAALHCLDNARYGIAWGALGAATFCWHHARNYVMNRKQFDRPLAANQLIQLKLANMQTQIALGLQGCIRVGELRSQHKCSSELVSLVKRNSALVALDVARNARDMLGANGILADEHIMRHVMNLETVNTYEGTQDIHALILGRAQTGIQAFR
jgi:glutaryl-CoA dehydrogenase